MCFSDGISEACNSRDELWHESEVENLLRTASGATAREVTERVVQAADAFTGDAEQADDMTSCHASRCLARGVNSSESLSPQHVTWDFDQSYEALTFEFDCSAGNQGNSLQARSLSFGKGHRLRRCRRGQSRRPHSRYRPKCRTDSARGPRCRPLPVRRIRRRELASPHVSRGAATAISSAHRTAAPRGSETGSKRPAVARNASPTVLIFSRPFRLAHSSNKTKRSPRLPTTSSGVWRSQNDVKLTRSTKSTATFSKRCGATSPVDFSSVTAARAICCRVISRPDAFLAPTVRWFRADSDEFAHVP